MEKAAAEEKQRKAAAAAEASRKRPPSAAAVPGTPDPKRLKLEEEVAASSSASFLASFDFTTLPASLVTDLIVANLQAISESALDSLVQTYVEKRTGSAASLVVVASAPAPDSTPARTPSATPVPTPPSAPAKHTPPPNDSAPVAGPSRSKSPPGESVIKEEPVDPLQMDIDQDDIDFEPDRLNNEVGEHHFCEFEYSLTDHPHQ